MKRISVILFFLFYVSFVFSQDGLKHDTVLVKSGKETRDLNTLADIKIIQNITSNGKDSIYVEIDAYAIRKAGDTLIVKPCFIDEYRYMDLNNPYNQRKYYEYTSGIEIKVPLKEIEKIKAKKQPLAFTLASIATIAYITNLTSLFVSVSNEKYSSTGLKIYLVSIPVLAVSWTLHYTWAKKRFRFDPNRTTKKIWTFN